jgi:hypothetical protein
MCYDDFEKIDLDDAGNLIESKCEWIGIASARQMMDYSYDDWLKRDYLPLSWSWELAVSAGRYLEWLDGC